GLHSPRDVAYANLYARLVLDALNTFAYPAEVAGLSYDIDVVPSGFLITVAGYNDKQPLLLHKVVDGFARLEPTTDKIVDYREELRRGWLNFVAERPYEQALASLTQVMVAGNWPPRQLADALEGVTPADFATWRAQRLDRYGALVLTHGNVDSSEADAVS